jgi:hypothetical protein
MVNSKKRKKILIAVSLFERGLFLVGVIFINQY